MGGGTSNHDTTPWGWSLEETNDIISAFDRLSLALRPTDRLPTRWEGEIRGKERSLRSTLRLVVEHKYKLGSASSARISFNMLFIKKPVEHFLIRQDIQWLLDAGSDQGLRLRNKDISQPLRENVLHEMARLEKRIKKRLTRIEEFFGPPENEGGKAPCDLLKLKLLSLRGLFVVILQIQLWGLYYGILQPYKNISRSLDSMHLPCTSQKFKPMSCFFDSIQRPGTCFLLFLVMIGFIGLSCFLGIFFTVHKEYGYSMGDAFTLAGFVVTVGGLVSSFIYFYHSRSGSCNCWDRSEKQGISFSSQLSSGEEQEDKMTEVSLDQSFGV